MEKKGSLFTVFLAVLIDLMGFGIVLPLLPFYASIFHATPIQIGLLYSIYSFAQLIFSPIWGSWSDRIGRRPIMLISTFGASLAYLVFGFSRSLSLLFLSRLIAGVMGGNISTAQAYIADVTTHKDRAKGMGLLGAAFGIGFVIGPAVATLLIHEKLAAFFHIEKFRYALPGFFAALLSFSSFLLVYFKLPETVTPKSRIADNERVIKPSVFSKIFWNSILGNGTQRKKLIPKLILCLFLIIFAQANLYSSFPLFCQDELHLNAEGVGLLFALMGMISVLVQGGAIKHLAQKFGEEKLFFLGNIVMMAGFLLAPFAPSVWVLAVFLSLMNLGSSLNTPTINSLVSKEADPKKVGAMMGTSQGIASLARVLGPTWGGFLYHFGHRLPFLMTGSLLGITVFIGFRVLRFHRVTTPDEKYYDTNPL